MEEMGHLGDALVYLAAQHDGVLGVEDAGRQDPEDDRKHGLRGSSLLLLFLGLQGVRASLRTVQIPPGQGLVFSQLGRISL